MAGSWAIERRASPWWTTVFVAASLLGWLFVFAVFGGAIQSSMPNSWVADAIGYLFLAGFVILLAAWVVACFSRLRIEVDEGARRVRKGVFAFGRSVRIRTWIDVEVAVHPKTARDYSSEGSGDVTRYVVILAKSSSGEQRVVGWFESVLFRIDHSVLIANAQVRTPESCR